MDDGPPQPPGQRNACIYVNGPWLTCGFPLALPLVARGTRRHPLQHRQRHPAEDAPGGENSASRDGGDTSRKAGLRRLGELDTRLETRRADRNRRGHLRGREGDAQGQPPQDDDGHSLPAMPPAAIITPDRRPGLQEARPCHHVLQEAPLHQQGRVRHIRPELGAARPGERQEEEGHGEEGDSEGHRVHTSKQRDKIRILS